MSAEAMESPAETDSTIVDVRELGLAALMRDKEQKSRLGLDLPSNIESPIVMAQRRRYQLIEKLLKKMNPATPQSQQVLNIRDIVSGTLWWSTTTPAVFTASELIDWLQENSGINFLERNEVVMFAQMFVKEGYIFSTEPSAVLRYDSTLWRLQSEKFWPSIHKDLSTDFDYAVYLLKRTMRKNKSYALTEMEQCAVNRLRNRLASQWPYVVIQAHEQLKAARSMNKKERVLADECERAFWQRARPKGEKNAFGAGDPMKTFRTPIAGIEDDVTRMTRESTEVEKMTIKLQQMKASLITARIKASIVAAKMANRCDRLTSLDGLMRSHTGSSPWLTGGADRRPMWEKHGKRLQTVTSARALSWSLSLDDLLADPLGVALLREFVTAEYSAESLSFYLEHIKFQKLETSALNDAAKTLFNRFVVSGADEEINLSAEVIADIRSVLETGNESVRWAFSKAARLIYFLINKDSYARFLKTDTYKALCKPDASSPRPPKSTQSMYQIASYKSSPNKTRSCHSASTSLANVSSVTIKTASANTANASKSVTVATTTSGGGAVAGSNGGAAQCASSSAPSRNPSTLRPSLSECASTLHNVSSSSQTTSPAGSSGAFPAAHSNHRYSSVSMQPPYNLAASAESQNTFLSASLGAASGFSAVSRKTSLSVPIVHLQGAIPPSTTTTDKEDHHHDLMHDPMTPAIAASTSPSLARALPSHSPSTSPRDFSGALYGTLL